MPHVEQAQNSGDPHELTILCKHACAALALGQRSKVFRHLPAAQQEEGYAVWVEHLRVLINLQHSATLNPKGLRCFSCWPSYRYCLAAARGTVKR